MLLLLARNTRLSSFNDKYYIAYVSLTDGNVYINEYDTNWINTHNYTMNPAITPMPATLDVPPTIKYNENSGNIYVVYQLGNLNSTITNPSTVNAVNEANNETLTLISQANMSDLSLQVNKFNLNWTVLDTYYALAAVETGRDVYMTYTDTQVTGGKDPYGAPLGIDEKYSQGLGSCSLRDNNYSFVYNSMLRDINRYNLTNINVNITVGSNVNLTDNASKIILSSSPKLFENMNLNSTNANIVEGVLTTEVSILETAKGEYLLTLTIENATSTYVIEIGSLSVADKQSPAIGNITLLNYADRTNTYYAGDMLYIRVPVEDKNPGLVRAFFIPYAVINGTTAYDVNGTIPLGDPNMDGIFDNDGKTGEFGTEFGSRFVPYSLPSNISGNKVGYNVTVYIVALDMCCNENVSRYTFSVTQRPEAPAQAAGGGGGGGGGAVRPPVPTIDSGNVIGGWGENLTKIPILVISAPKEVMPNKTFAIKVTENNESGMPVPNATVTVFWADKTTTTDLTDLEGKIYVSSSAYGSINVTAEKKGYQTAKEYYLTKILRLELKVNISDKILTNQEFEVTVVDAKDYAVQGSKVTLTLPDETKLEGLTDAEGKIRFKSTGASGAITAVATKEDYIGSEDTSNIDKRKLSVSSPESIDVGKEVVIKVVDENENLVVNAKVIITMPDGKQIEIMTDSKGIASIKAELTGTIKVAATKEGYTESEGKTFVVEPPVKVDFTNYLLLIGLLILILFLLLLVLRGKVEVTKIKSGDTVKVKIKNGTRGKLNGCVLEDKIPLGAEVDVLTIGVRKIDHKLMWDLGNIPAGEERVMEYRITGIEEVKEKAKLIWVDGEKESD